MSTSKVKQQEPAHGRPTRHRLLPMLGRDPSERRASSPLELLFDLTFAVSFARVGDAGASLLIAGHVGPAIGGFVFTAAAICLAWINFSWFSSAYDTEDWAFRLLTLLQMSGVVLLALGVPAVFSTLDRGGAVDIGVLVAGFVVMRVALVAQWVRAAVQDRRHRRSALVYAGTLLIAQVGWVVLASARVQQQWVFWLATSLLYVIELGGPVVAKLIPHGAPWNPHHMAERYGLLVIVTLGEDISGVVFAVSSIVDRSGWTLDSAVFVFAGIALTFMVWWAYFLIPFSTFLERHRYRLWSFGYGHIVIFASVAAVGMGLLVAAAPGAERAAGEVAALLAVVVPLTVFTAAYFVVYALMAKRFERFHLGLFALEVAVLTSAVLLALAHVPLAWCLLVSAAAPAITVVGYEAVGYRLISADLDEATP